MDGWVDGWMDGWMIEVQTMALINLKSWFLVVGFGSPLFH